MINSIIVDRPISIETTPENNYSSDSTITTTRQFQSPFAQVSETPTQTFLTSDREQTSETNTDSQQLSKSKIITQAEQNTQQAIDNEYEQEYGYTGSSEFYAYGNENLDTSDSESIEEEQQILEELGQVSQQVQYLGISY